jgi:flagellar motor switch protein FliM
MTSAFEPVTDVEFQLERMEANPSLVEIASPPSLAVLFTIDVRLGERGGRIEILIPYATLEPMSDVLDQMFTGEKSGHDSIWESHLAGQMIRSDAELEVTFGDQMMPLGKILDLQVGSTLTLRNKPEDPVMLRCGSTALMHADVGRVGDCMAIRIANWCDGARRSASRKGCRLG